MFTGESFCVFRVMTRDSFVVKLLRPEETGGTIGVGFEEVLIGGG
jgi:hypothetical protein